MKTATFRTEQFQFSHGKSPKGWGQWMFEANTGETFSHSGSLTEAKQAAKKHFRSDPEVFSVEVCP